MVALTALAVFTASLYSTYTHCLDVSGDVINGLQVDPDSTERLIWRDWTDNPISLAHPGIYKTDKSVLEGYYQYRAKCQDWPHLDY